MKSLVRIDFGDGYSRLLFIECNGDASMFKDEHGIIHLKYVDGKLVIQDQPIEMVIKGEFA
jgi:hypothetical protein